MTIRELNEIDVDEVYALCTGNPTYYRFCPPMVTREDIIEDMKALPPGITKKDKHYIGFYQDDNLTAVMDLIYGYPDERTAFIGFFMMNAAMQGRGIGSQIIAYVLNQLSEKGFLSVRLGYVRDNAQARKFWNKNEFVAIKETIGNVDGPIILMEKQLGCKLIFTVALETDLAEIMQLIQKSVARMAELDVHQWDESYPDETTIANDIMKQQLYVGRFDDSIVAICVVNRDCDEDYANAEWRGSDNYMVLHRLCVHPSFHNKRVARKTMEFVERLAKSKGAEAIRLDTFSQNPYAIKLYENYGYEIRGKAYWSKGEYYIMEKNWSAFDE